MKLKFEDYAKNVLQSDIPETYQPVVELIGIDAFLKLCQYCMGDELYFPMIDTIFRNTRDRMILKEYNGRNIKALAQKYDMTIKQMKNIIKGSNSHK